MFIRSGTGGQGLRSGGDGRERRGDKKLVG